MSIKRIPTLPIDQTFQFAIPIPTKTKNTGSQYRCTLFKWNVGTKLIVEDRFPFMYGNSGSVYDSVSYSQKFIN